jgi:hypothetical protein
VTRAALHGGTPSVWSPHSYANSSFREEGYQCAVVSRQILCQPRLPPALSYKATFAYEYILVHASTCRDMHVHAVLSSKEARIRSMTEERMSRWLHRPDV